MDGKKHMNPACEYVFEIRRGFDIIGPRELSAFCHKLVLLSPLCLTLKNTEMASPTLSALLSAINI